MSYSHYRRPASFSRSPRPNQGRPNRRQPKKEYIHPSKFIKEARPASTTEYSPTHKFSDFKVHSLLHANLKAKGFEEPSPIQDQAIPAGLLGKDVVGIADTGTGKTAAFAVPLLHRLMADRNARALILAPTRELAQQIEGECRSLAKNSGLYGALLIGGVAMSPQIRDLRANPQIVIGTPGRIKDHAERGTLNLPKFNIVVLDEVDRMLDMGFINDIRHILSQTADTRQCLFFSATLDARVKAIIDGFCTDPQYVMVKTSETTDNVEQNIVTYNSSGDKISKLHDLLLQEKVAKTLVFDDTHRSVEKLCKELQLRGFEAEAIHGGKSQSQRGRALRRFKDSQVKILVATDVAARGLDVTDITHVVNYSTPQSYGDYIHRVGRAGRAGRLGYALTFIEK